MSAGTARVAMVALLAASGCGSILGYKDPVLGDVDGGSDGDGGGGACYGTGLVQVCFAQPPTGSLSVTGTQMIDTGNSITCSTAVTSGGTGYCVVPFETIDIPSGARLEGKGSAPLVLVATGTLTVAGTLDVASQVTGDRGAGGNFSGCSNGTSPGTDGGGAGGSFGSKGGNGGGPSASMAGAVLAAPTMLHGGCKGRDGSGPEQGKAGEGGGAVYLIAGSQIIVSGAVNASGAGAERPENTGRGGGGGGGSGGMIGLDAPTVNLTGVVFANGGGGGEGSEATVRGNSGADPINAAAGQGGAGASSAGGDGGDGAAGTANGAPGLDGVAGTAGGGGGGGGAGVIKIHGTRTGTGTVSPPAS